MQHFHSQAITVTNNTYAYRGFGYQYFLHQATKLGTYAKLRITREVFNLFRHQQEKEPRVYQKGQQVETLRPRIKDLVGLEILAGTNGWYTITVLDEAFACSVQRFLARLNKWMLARRQAAQAVQFEKVNNSLHRIYEIALDNRGRPVQAQPRAWYDRPHHPIQATPKQAPAQAAKPSVDSSRLKQLAETVNARFGHV